MKVKVNWKELGRQLWAAVKPVLLAAIGGGIVSIAAHKGHTQMTITKKTRLLPIPFVGSRILIKLDDADSLTMGIRAYAKTLGD